MDELHDGEWLEQARWIKYEEDLLDGAGRWGRAHISSLSFHSVINLRLVLESCKIYKFLTSKPKNRMFDVHVQLLSKCSEFKIFVHNNVKIFDI